MALHPPKINACLRAACLVIVLTVTAGNIMGQTGYVWAKSIGGKEYKDYGLDADCDTDGQIYLAGEFDDTVDFGGTVFMGVGFGDMYTCKLGDDGNFEWVLQAGSTADDRNFSVDWAEDQHVYTCGYGKVPYPESRGEELHQFDAITVRTRPNGTVAWGRAMQGDIFSEALDIVADAAGNSYTVGQLQTNGWYGLDTLHGHGLKDAFVVKFDSTGNFVWGKTFGGNSNDYANTVGIDRQGNVWVGGSFSGVGHFDAVTLVTTGNSDAYIAKLDPNGNVLFVKAFTGPSSAEVYEVAMSADGDCYFTGDFAGTLSFPTTTLTAVDTLDLFYGKLDAGGGFLWARQAGGMDLDVPQDMELDADENIYLTGYFFGGLDWQSYNHPNAGYDHMFFAKTDSNGILLLIEDTSDTTGVGGFGIAVDPAQNIVLSGSYTGYLTLGTDNLSSNAFSTDIFVAKYATRLQQLAVLDVIGTPYCSSDQFQVAFQAWGNFPPGNVFTVELSDPNGSFAAPQVVGSLAGSFGDTIYATIPPSIVAGTHYRLRLRASQPVVYSPDNGQDITLDPNTSIPVAILGDTVLCNGLPVNLNVAPAFVHQVWSTGDTTQSIVVMQPGTVWVEATDSNGCTNRAEVLVITCVGLPLQANSSFLHLAPNPAVVGTSLLIGAGHPGNYELLLVDLRGKPCLRRSLVVGSASTSVLLDLSELSSGIYFVSIQNGQQQARLRLVVQ